MSRKPKKRMLNLGMVVLLSGLFVSPNVKAQSRLVLSNLATSSDMSEDIASDAWVYARFRTGDYPGGYRLDSVQLMMGEASGNPDGFRVSLYTVATSDADTFIGELEGPDPITGGLYTYEAADITLSPSSNYYVVLTSGSKSAEGFYRWRISSGAGFTREEGWNMDGSYSKSDSGSDWTLGGRARMQYAIYATPIPTLSIRTMPSGDEVEIRWTSVEGVPYQLQTRSSLSTGDWTDLGEPLTGDGSELTVTAPVVPGEAYFRVAVLPAE